MIMAANSLGTARDLAWRGNLGDANSFLVWYGTSGLEVIHYDQSAAQRKITTAAPLLNGW
jgi:hypothetical protein